MPPTAAELVARLYVSWNEDGLRSLTESIDPDVELVCDPLCPAASTLRGIDGWRQWTRRWHDGYESMRIMIDGLIPMSGEHVLALVSINAVARGANRPRSWAAAHLWTVRDGRIVRYETHVDIELARGTLP